MDPSKADLQKDGIRQRRALLEKAQKDLVAVAVPHVSGPPCEHGIQPFLEEHISTRSHVCLYIYT